MAVTAGGPTAPVSGPAPAVPSQSSAATAATTVRHDLVAADWVELYYFINVGDEAAVFSRGSSVH